MFELIYNSLGVLSRRQLVGFRKIIFLFIWLSAFEALSIYLVMPFLTLILDFESAIQNPVIDFVFKFYTLHWGNDPAGFVSSIGVFVLFFLILSFLVRISIVRKANNFIETVRHEISLELLRCKMYQPYEVFVVQNSSEIVKTVLADVDHFGGVVLRPLIKMLAGVTLCVFIFVVLFLANKWISISVVSCVLLIYVFLLRGFRKRLIDLGRARVQSNARRFSAATELLAGFKEIRVSGHSEVFLDTYAKHSRAYASACARHQTINISPQLIVEFILFGGLVFGALVISLYGANTSQLEVLIPSLGVFVVGAMKLKPAAHSVYQGLASLEYGKAVVESLSQGLSVKPNARCSTGSEISIYENCLAFKNVSCRYESEAENVFHLRNISFVIRHPSVVALVGPSGSGKSTVVDLALGLLSPQTGSVLIGRDAIGEVDEQQFSKLVGYVAQKPFISDSSIAENIAFGVNRDEIDMVAVQKSAWLACLEDFIELQEDGYFAPVGEGGALLSGGQIQRLAIARAVYKQPKLLVLDEATNALDPLTEARVIQNIRSSGVSVLMVTHNLALTKTVDTILCLNNGVLVEQGSYYELMSRDGVFKNLLGNIQDDL